MQRVFVLLYEGAPSSLCVTEGHVREHIAAFAPRDADSIDVWTIYQDKRLTRDVSQEFAEDIQALRFRDKSNVHSLRHARSL